MAFRYYSAERVREKMPQFRGTDEELQEMIDNISLQYASAIKGLETKLEILSDDFNKKHEYMPIHHIQSRLKTFDSIMEKAVRYGIEDPINNLDVVTREILDIAGIRVICNYAADVYAMSDILLKQEDVDLIKIKDYCAEPKEGGYRSLHVVVAVPVYLVNGKKIVPVELQFRSIAQDVWATLEHQLRYKNKGALNQEIQDELKNCANILADVDKRMARVRNIVYAKDSKYSDY